MLPASLRIWAIDLLLAVFVVAFGMMSFDVWSRGEEPIPEIPSAKGAEKAPAGKGIVERTMPPDSAFSLVAEKNLFSQSRSEIVPEKAKAGPLKISEKQIFLYGIMAAGDRKKALINNPEPAAAPGKAAPRDKWVAVGDSVGAFSVTEIRKDRIVLADGASSHEILLFDKNKPARQTTVAEKSAAPTVVAAGKAAPAAPETAAAPKADAKPQPPTAPAADGKAAPAPEYRIINTPFGPVKQRIQ